ncbi:hypothetical protein NKH18_50405 [Streptomyces sp. M10(2022)]
MGPPQDRNTRAGCDEHVHPQPRDAGGRGRDGHRTGRVRYVTGSATGRVFERDLLGYGVVGARTASQVYDLPSMLAEQPEGLRDWMRQPVSELPGILDAGLAPGEHGAQLWLHLGTDPDSSRLARALYVVSHTAVAAGRPVELATRGTTGLRFWPFAADGSLADTTPATQDTWDRLRGAIEAVGDATAAEADAASRTAELLPAVREAGWLRDDAESVWTEAGAEHTVAVRTLDQARARRDLLVNWLDEARQGTWRPAGTPYGPSPASRRPRRGSRMRTAPCGPPTTVRR